MATKDAMDTVTSKEIQFFHNLERVEGLGVDIESISRFKKVLSNKIFLKKIFTDKELIYCLNKNNPGQHLAARFAGKEAVIKACSKSLGIIAMNKIEILPDSDGTPYVTIINKKGNNHDIKISLSHSSTQAIAFAIFFNRS